MSLLCDASTGGCKDSCASTGSIYEYYCAGQPTAQSCMKQQVACSSSEFCWGGKCMDTANPPVLSCSVLIELTARLSLADNTQPAGK